MAPKQNFTTLAEKYGYSPSAIAAHCKKAAIAQGLEWPVKPLTERNPRRKSVPADLSRTTLIDLKLRYRITYATMAEHTGLDVTGVRHIASRVAERVLHSTQAKILEFAVKLDQGELVLPHEPVRLRDFPLCPFGHPYTGKVDSRGNRVCVVCRADKARRGAPRIAERRLAERKRKRKNKLARIRYARKKLEQLRPQPLESNDEGTQAA